MSYLLTHLLLLLQSIFASSHFIHWIIQYNLKWLRIWDKINTIRRKTQISFGSHFRDKLETSESHNSPELFSSATSLLISNSSVDMRKFAIFLTLVASQIILAERQQQQVSWINKKRNLKCWRFNQTLWILMTRFVPVPKSWKWNRTWRLCEQNYQLRVGEVEHWESARERKGGWKIYFEWDEWRAEKLFGRIQRQSDDNKFSCLCTQQS